jgi:hypothetical protein
MLTRPPRNHARCCRRSCKQRYDQHTGDERTCPDGKRAFQRSANKAVRAAQSFTAAEVDVMRDVLRGIEQGKDLRLLAIQKFRELGALQRKAVAMRNTLDRVRASKAAV